MLQWYAFEIRSFFLCFPARCAAANPRSIEIQPMGLHCWELQTHELQEDVSMGLRYCKLQTHGRKKACSMGLHKAKVQTHIKQNQRIGVCKTKNCKPKSTKEREHGFAVVKQTRVTVNT